VVLANGVRVAAASELGAGTPVALSLRPERAHIQARAATPPSEASSAVDGVVSTATYLGNALVYDVMLDWMEVEIRDENTPGRQRFGAGDEVTVSWRPDSVSVVPD